MIYWIDSDQDILDVIEEGLLEECPELEGRISFVTQWSDIEEKAGDVVVSGLVGIGEDPKTEGITRYTCSGAILEDQGVKIDIPKPVAVSHAVKLLSKHL